MSASAEAIILAISEAAFAGENFVSKTNYIESNQRLSTREHN